MNAMVQQRLRFIDFLLDHVGFFRRDMLADYWGLSIPQVSADIKLFNEQSNNMAVYNSTSKRYEQATAYNRTFI